MQPTVTSVIVMFEEAEPTCLIRSRRDFCVYDRTPGNSDLWIGLKGYGEYGRIYHSAPWPIILPPW